MSKDPKPCSIPGCPNKPLYKIGLKGFCEQHKPKLKVSDGWIGKVANEQ